MVDDRNSNLTDNEFFKQAKLSEQNLLPSFFFKDQRLFVKAPSSTHIQSILELEHYFFRCFCNFECRTWTRNRQSENTENETA